MAEHLVELTRGGDGTLTTRILVNLSNVAWIESLPDGAARVVFASGLQGAQGGTTPLDIVVRESIQEIARLGASIATSDGHAIASAWAEQSRRRGLEDQAQ